MLSGIDGYFLGICPVFSLPSISNPNYYTSNGEIEILQTITKSKVKVIP